VFIFSDSAAGISVRRFRSTSCFAGDVAEPT
jgi:hypothetical protein